MSEATRASAPLPLEGVVVVDFSRALAGPYCTALLGDLGAEIIKVEGLGGDITRAWPPFEDEHSLYFESTNRNKRSICVDPYGAAGQRVIAELVERADVVIENFRPGVLAKMGIDVDALRVRRPDVVVASISGFGTTGPLADVAGLDQVAQGMGGLASVTGPAAGDGYRFGVPIVDMTSGMFAAIGILAELVQRGTTGRGGRVETSLLESAIALGAFQAQRYLSTGQVPTPQGNDHASLTPYGLFRTADAPIIIAAANDAQWRTLCAVLGDPSLGERPEFATGRGRTEHREEVCAALEALLREHGVDHWLPRIREAGIPCGPSYSYDRVFADDQVRALEVVDTVERADGSTLPLLRGPISIDGARPRVRRRPPQLGEDTREVLDRLGYRADEVDRLFADGAVKAAAPIGALTAASPAVPAARRRWPRRRADR